MKLIERPLALILALTLCSPLAALALTQDPSADAGETNGNAAITETAGNAALAAATDGNAIPMEDSNGLEDPDSSTVTPEDAILNAAPVGEEPAAIGTVTGFAPLENNFLALTERIPLEEVVSYMPGTLSVYLDDSKETVDIPVTWYCLDDYETSTDFYFQFSPQWDTDLYPLAQGLDVTRDAPYMAVFMDHPMVTRSAASVKQDIYDYLTGEMGLNTAAACGVLANAYAESSFNETAQSNASTGAISYGLFQWTGSRFTNLKNWCKSKGLNYTTAKGQMAFLEYELTNSYSSVLSYLRKCTNNAQGAYNAGYYFCYHFEKPSKTEERSVTRGNLAKNTYWPEFGGSVSSTPVISGASTPPDSFKQGTGISVYGTISCSKALTKVTAGVYNTSGSLVTGKSVAPKTTTYNLSALDNYVKFSALSPGSYTYKVTASTSSGSYTLLKSSFKVTSATSKPAQVTGLKTSKASTNQLTIVWNKVSGATGYEVYYCRTFDGSYQLLRTVTSPTYTTGTGLTAGRGYYYKVRAVNKSGKGAYSSRLSTQTALAKKTTATTTSALHLRAHAGTSYDSTLLLPKNAKLTVVCKTWDKSGTVWYKVQYTKSGKTYTGYCHSKWLKVTTTAATAAAATKLAQVTGLKASKVAQHQLTIAWNKVSGATGYEVYYCRTFDGSYQLLRTVTSPTYTTGTGLTAGRGYYYKVRAVNKSGKGAYSSRLSTQTALAKSTTATTTSILYLRSHAGTSYDSLLLLPKKAKLTVVCKTWDKSGTVWYKVKYTKSGKTYTGYCHSTWLKISTSGSSSSSASSASAAKLAITTAWVNLRQKASSASKVLTVVPRYTTLTSSGNSGNWYKAKYTSGSKSYTGYLYKDYVKVGTRVKVTKNTYIYKKTSTASNKNKTLTAGSTIVAFDSTKDSSGTRWYQVKCTKNGNCYSGYCKASLLNFY